MVQSLDPGPEVSEITSSRPDNVTTSEDDRAPSDIDDAYYPTETVAAVTIAILAVVIVITMLLVFRALRKRQRARQGEQFGETAVPTITTGVMGTGGAAYANAVQNVPVRGQVRWESVNPSSGGDNTSQPPHR
ncbi:hypothetical protein ACF0H5_006947 [Mactra antiquata]